MESLTGSFPSRIRVTLDNVLFYRGPSPEKSRQATSADREEWPDIDEMLAQAAREGWTAGFDTGGVDESCPQLPPMTAISGTSAKVPRSITGVDGEFDVEDLFGGIGGWHADKCVNDDSAGWFPTPATCSLRPSATLEGMTNEGSLFPGASPIDVSVEFAGRRDGFPPGDDRLQSHQVSRRPSTGECATPAEGAGTPAEQEAMACGEKNVGVSGLDSHIEQDDSDVPVLPRRRCWRRPSIEGSHARAQVANTPFTPSTSRTSTAANSAVACRRRRLHRGRKRSRDSNRTGRNVPPATYILSASTLTGVANQRWPVQCVLERRSVGSREVITIELPALSLSSPSAREASILRDTRARTPALVNACGKMRRARFSRAEEDLLIELKGRRDPKRSWKEIQTHFPNRTTGSLQFLYCTRLKGRRISK